MDCEIYCSNNSAKTRYSAKAGAHNLRLIEAGVEYRKISDLKCHEKFTYPPFNDIAIVKLESPIEFSDNIRPIDLPEFNHRLYWDDYCTLTGWGWTQYEGSCFIFLENLVCFF